MYSHTKSPENRKSLPIISKNHPVLLKRPNSVCGVHVKSIVDKYENLSSPIEKCDKTVFNYRLSPRSMSESEKDSKEKRKTPTQDIKEEENVYRPEQNIVKRRVCSFNELAKIDKEGVEKSVVEDVGIKKRSIKRRSSYRSAMDPKNSPTSQRSQASSSKENKLQLTQKSPFLKNKKEREYLQQNKAATIGRLPVKDRPPIPTLNKTGKNYKQLETALAKRKSTSPSRGPDKNSSKFGSLTPSRGVDKPSSSSCSSLIPSRGSDKINSNTSREKYPEKVKNAGSFKSLLDKYEKNENVKNTVKPTKVKSITKTLQKFGESSTSANSDNKAPIFDKPLRDKNFKIKVPELKENTDINDKQEKSSEAVVEGNITNKPISNEVEIAIPQIEICSPKVDGINDCKSCLSKRSNSDSNIFLRDDNSPAINKAVSSEEINNNDGYVKNSSEESTNNCVSPSKLTGKYQKNSEHYFLNRFHQKLKKSIENIKEAINRKEETIVTKEDQKDSAYYSDGDALDSINFIDNDGNHFTNEIEVCDDGTEFIFINVEKTDNVDSEQTSNESQQLEIKDKNGRLSESQCTIDEAVDDLADKSQSLPGVNQKEVKIKRVHAKLKQTNSNEINESRLLRRTNSKTFNESQRLKVMTKKERSLSESQVATNEDKEITDSIHKSASFCDDPYEQVNLKRTANKTDESQAQNKSKKERSQSESRPITDEDDKRINDAFRRSKTFFKNDQDKAIENNLSEQTALLKHEESQSFQFDNLIYYLQETACDSFGEDKDDSISLTEAVNPLVVKSFAETELHDPQEKEPQEGQSSEEPRKKRHVIRYSQFFGTDGRQTFIVYDNQKNPIIKTDVRPCFPAEKVRRNQVEENENEIVEDLEDTKVDSTDDVFIGNDVKLRRKNVQGQPTGNDIKEENLQQINQKKITQ